MNKFEKPMDKNNGNLADGKDKFGSLSEDKEVKAYMQSEEVKGLHDAPVEFVDEEKGAEVVPITGKSAEEMEKEASELSEKIKSQIN
ncbi:MAG: hypothetical protein WC870_01715 [Candidatus Paceibacterota bacterium]